MKSVIAVVGKFPKRDFVKTRLAASLGKDVALNLYIRFMQDFFKRLKANVEKRPFYFFATPSNKEVRDYFQHLFKQIGLPVHFFFQKEVAFFSRLEYVFETIGQREGRDTFIHLTGTDIPDFPFEVMEEAQEAQEAQEQSGLVSIGPDFDGGYYYIGASASKSAIFRIHPTELFPPCESTVRKCQELGLASQKLKNWGDIDEEADLQNCLKRSSHIIPHTYEYCQEIALPALRQL